VSRPRTHASNAARQRAYRLRLATPPAEAEPRSAKPQRPPSRPRRLAALRSEAETLLQEYQTWLDSLPEPLHDSGQADKLMETIQQLEQVVDILSDLDPPRGFGRD
jgi:hypothetical protein